MYVAVLSRLDNGELMFSGDKHYSCCKSRKLKGSVDTVKTAEHLGVHIIVSAWK
jgi:hypothetical protein